MRRLYHFATGKVTGVTHVTQFTHNDSEYMLECQTQAAVTLCCRFIPKIYAEPTAINQSQEPAKNVHSVTVYNNNNNNKHDNGAVIMTKVIARVHPVHLMNVD